MIYFLTIFIYFLGTFLKAESTSLDSEILFNYHIQRGFDEINNKYQFEKSIIYLEKMLEDPNNSQARREELVEKKRVLQERIETFSSLKSNKFPIGPIISQSYENHHRYEPAYKMALNGSMDEVKEILRQMSIREGQITVLFLRDENVPMAAEEVAYRKLEGFPYYHPLTRENMLEIFRKNINLRDIQENPGILKDFFQKEPWDLLVLLNITNHFSKSITDNEGYYTIDLYKVYYKDSDKIIQIASMSSSGVNTGLYHKIAARDTLFFSFFIFILLISSLLIVFRKNNTIKPEDSKITNIIENIELLEYLKGLGISLLFVGLGFGFCFGLGLGSEEILGSWNTHVGSLQVQSTIILIIIMLIINPVLLLVLTKITDYVSMVKMRFYLPILLSAFYSGMALYMHFFYELYEAIFPGDNHILGIYLMSIGTVLNGFVTGETYRELIDLNSKKALYNVSEKLNSGGVITKTNPLVYKRFSIYFLLIFITAMISVSSLDTFFKASSFVSPFLFVSLIIVSVTLYFLKNHYQLNVQEIIYNKKSIQKEVPKTIEELKELLEDPDKIPYLFEKDIDIEKIINGIHLCFKEEGGTIAFYGGKWSGKNRLIQEVLNDPQFSGRTEFKVECLSETDNLIPFIEGMKSLPQIQSILENVKLGKGAKKAAGLLSNVFSFIPVAGGLISKFFESEMEFTGKENQKFLEKTLIDTIHNLSKEIKESKSEEGKTRDQLIFIIDNFQSINDKMFDLIEKIQERIKDRILSPEDNNIAFLLLINTDYRTDLFERHEFSSVFPRDKNLNFNLEGFTKEMAYEYFHNILNFGKTRKNDDLLEKIIEIYGEKDKKNEYRIFPKYITETLLHELTYIATKEEQFIYSGNPLQLSITPSIYFEYNKKLDFLRAEERKILEAASIFGNTFNIKEVSYVLDTEPLSLLEEIRLLEKEEEIIVRISGEGDFKFKKGVYREAFRRRIVNRIYTDEKKEIPFQIFIEYCNRASDYYKSKNNNSLIEKQRFANISRYSSEERIEISLQANLDFSRDVFKFPEYQIQGITALDVVIEKIIKSEHKSSIRGMSITESLDSYGLLLDFVRIFSFYFNDFQEYIPTNFPNLKEFLIDLISKEGIFILRNESTLLNDLTLIYFFYDPKLISIAKKFNQKSLELNSQKGDRLWSEFWESFFLKIEGNINFKTNLDFSESCYTKSINLSESILNKMDLITDEYWNKNLKSRIYNTLAECYQRLTILHSNSTEYLQNMEKYCNLTLEFKNEIQDFTGMAMLYNVRAGYYSLQTDGYLKAKKDLEECKKLNEEMKNYKGLYFTYMGLSSLEEKFNGDPNLYKREAEKIRKINNLN